MISLPPVLFDALLDAYQKQAEDLVTGHQSGECEITRLIQEYHPAFRCQSAADVRAAPLSLTDAQLTIARFYQFADWQFLTRYVAEVSRERSLVWQFESAVEAIIGGDIAQLQRQLRHNPDLVRLRSMRQHGAMLLHYMSANGVERYRQKTPANTVAMAQLLLNTGADVDALADIYGQETTLGLVTTSVQTLRAGVQTSLIETLLAHGAAIDGAPNRWPPLMAALANGRLLAAKTLAHHGAHVGNVVAAAGIGRLDLVKRFFDLTGNLRPLSPDASLWGIPAESKAQLESAFFYACRYGHIDVADFLLIQGVRPTAQDNAGQTGLHWAVIGGQLRTVNWLLNRHCPLLMIRNIYGSTALGQACWCAVNGDPLVDYLLIIEALLDAGSGIDTDTLDWLARQPTSPQTKTRLEAIFRQQSETL